MSWDGPYKKEYNQPWLCEACGDFVDGWRVACKLCRVKTSPELPGSSTSSSHGAPLKPGRLTAAAATPIFCQFAHDARPEMEELPLSWVRAAAPSLRSPCHTWRLRSYRARAEDQLPFAEAKNRRIGKALHAALCDPITGELMRNPVMTPEGTTYDRASIMRWIDRNPSNPLTRLLLQQWMLRPNRQAEELLVILRQQYPELEEPVANLENHLEVPAARMCPRDLFHAVANKMTEKALEILAGPVDNEILNSDYEHGGHRGSLLFWALCTDSQEVALAFVRRDDFRAFLFPTSMGLSHLQLAAALGLTELCKELLKRQPLEMALASTPRDENIEFTFTHSSRSYKRLCCIAAGSTAMSIARQFQQYEIEELIRDAKSQSG